MKSSIFIAIIFLISVQGAWAQSDLNGTWKVVALSGHGPEGDWSINDVQPGLIIFNDSYYSEMIIWSEGARALFTDNANRTDAEKVAAFDPFTAHAGSYEVAGEMIKSKRIVAKNPNSMAAARITETEYQVDGNKLVLNRSGEGWTMQIGLERLK